MTRFDIHSQHGLYEQGADETRLAAMADMVDALDTPAPFWRAWCDVEPIIVTPAGSHGETLASLPAAALEWLNQDRG